MEMPEHGILRACDAKTATKESAHKRNLEKQRAIQEALLEKEEEEAEARKKLNLELHCLLVEIEDHITRTIKHGDYSFEFHFKYGTTENLLCAVKTTLEILGYKVELCKPPPQVAAGWNYSIVIDWQCK